MSDVERVARALLCEAEGWPLARLGDGSLDWYFTTPIEPWPEIVAGLRSKARAAIAAMQPLPMPPNTIRDMKTGEPVSDRWPGETS